MSNSKLEVFAEISSRSLLGMSDAARKTKLRDWISKSKPVLDKWCEFAERKTPGNVDWCSRNCLGEGGMWTKTFNKSRKAEVEAFIDARKEVCGKLKQFARDAQEELHPRRR